jgi:hypothetical protein
MLAEVISNMRTTLFFRSLVAAAVLTLFAATASFADHDGHGGRDGGRDGGKSFNADGGSSQSFSNRSFKGSSDSNRSFSRTFRDSDSHSQKSFDSSRNFQGNRQYQVLRPSDDQTNNFFKFKGNDNFGRTRERNPQDRALVDREYKQWQNFWSGQKGDGHDHRDWTGNWKNSDRFNVADSIRRDWHGKKDNDFPFRSEWWNKNHHGNYWAFWGDYSRRYNRPWYWWSWATGPRLATWFVFGWPTPYYWDYGPGEYIYCNNGAIYVNGQWWAPAPVYYDQTVRLIDQAPDLTSQTAANLDWMPLGVFSVTPDGVAEPMITVQLAVTKDGVIGGTAFDQKSGAAYRIEGIVDKRTQRAVWSYTNDRNQRINMETSIYNLTQPEATGLVQYSPTDMRVIELVRLQEPTSGNPTTDTLPAPQPVPQH